MKKLSFLLALMMLVGGVLVGCGGGNTDGEGNGDNAEVVLPVHVGTNPDTIDPALNSAVDGATLIIHGFEGLYILDKDGVPTPGQAETVDISDDGLTYTFHLRDGLKWSDGSDLTAEDFVYSWNRAIAPETAADYAYMFESIKGFADGELDVTAVDAKTLEVNLVAVTPYFLELTAFPTFSPVQKATVEANGEQWALAPETYVGNGPYKLVEWTPSANMVYEKNENYWNVAALGPDKINFILMEDANAVLAAFETGEILFGDDIPTEEIDAWRDKDEFYIEGQLGTYYVSFNTQKAPFDDPLVREAFSLAIDREFICKEIGKGGQQPASAFVAIGLSDADPTKEFRDVGGDYYDPTAAGFEANLARAKEALKEAGYENGEGLPAVEYLYNVEGDGHRLIAEALQQMWGELGVEVTLGSQEWATFLNTRKNGDYQIARNGWLGDYNDPISFLDMWITSSGNNDAQWSNAEYDKLIADVKASSDQAERFEKMHKAEDIIFEESMLAPIYYYVDLYLMSNKLQNAYSSPLGYKYFMFATVAE
ncbi:MAG TPA: peptide ABC transporter substrate-binding protein [Oscillospiraceae bacterium]|nr:peptide ABC transporter substrate-binding protein [Oscillospiraceae bacterium]